MARLNGKGAPGSEHGGCVVGEMRRLGRWVVWAGLVASGGVGAWPGQAAWAQEKAEDYGDQVRKAWLEAEDALEDEDFVTAVRLYNVLRTRYPYSEFATLADLRIGDAYFQQEKYVTSVEQYRAFVKLHPDHPKVPYASWKIAQSFYEQMPKDVFFKPPGYERDLSRAKEAAREIEYFIKNFPTSQYTTEAETYLRRTRRRLADHEFYVATFYLEQQQPRAAALRLTTLLREYAGLGLDAQALFLLSRAYLELGDVDKGVRPLYDLIKYHPGHPLTLKAKTYLQEHGLGQGGGKKG